MERGLPFDVSNNVAVYTTDLARKICDKAGIPLGKAEEAKEKVHTPLCGLTTQHNTTRVNSTHDYGDVQTMTPSSSGICSVHPVS